MYKFETKIERDRERERGKKEEKERLPFKPNCQELCPSFHFQRVGSDCPKLEVPKKVPTRSTMLPTICRLAICRQISCWHFVVFFWTICQKKMQYFLGTKRNLRCINQKTAVGILSFFLDDLSKKDAIFFGN